MLISGAVAGVEVLLSSQGEQEYLLWGSQPLAERWHRAALQGSAGWAGLSLAAPSHVCRLDACHFTGMPWRAGEGKDAHRFARTIWLSPF